MENEEGRGLMNVKSERNKTYVNNFFKLLGPNIDREKCLIFS